MFKRCDGETIVVAGGLSGGLAALALVEAGRGETLTLLEESDRREGFTHGRSHGLTSTPTSAPSSSRRELRWPAQTVRFPGASERCRLGRVADVGRLRSNHSGRLARGLSGSV